MTQFQRRRMRSKKKKEEEKPRAKGSDVLDFKMKKKKTD